MEQTQNQPGYVNPKLAAKLSRAAYEIGNIEKTGVNSFHNYKFVSAVDVNNRCRRIMYEVGLAIVGTNYVFVDSIDTIGKSPQNKAVCELRVAIACTETGAVATFTGCGTGLDRGDKHQYKAATGALKYLLIGAFLIGLGEDPEADAQVDRNAESGPSKKPVKLIKSTDWSQVIKLIHAADAIEDLKEISRPACMPTNKERDALRDAITAVAAVLDIDEETAKSAVLS